MADWTMDDVVRFAQQRHTAWAGLPVIDPIVETHKFTNVFRVLDRGSQYLLHLMNECVYLEDALALSYLYRQVNKPSSMNTIISYNGGQLPTLYDVTNPSWIDEVVRPAAEATQGPFLNGAYIILIKPGDKRGLIDKMIATFPLAEDTLWRVANAPALANRVAILQTIDGVGPFLAMQIATDLGYVEGEEDQENDFVLPGPGSKNGMKALGMPATVETLRSFPVDQIPSLPGSNGRPASLMDVQNVFCEFSKYVRYANKGQTSGQSYQRHRPFKVKIPSQFKR